MMNLLKMNNILLGNKLLIFILLISAVLRIWNISNIPPGLTWDEAAFGYNAYSILNTGKDEYGKVLPANLKSFGDYKPALYAYTIIPFISVFGLNEFSIRLPSAIFGVLTTLLIYLLADAIFSKKILSLLAALSLAISPLSIQFSRAGFESNMALMLNTLGVYLFMLGLKKKNLLFYSALVLSLSLFTYQASRIFVPLTVVLLFLVFRNKIELRSPQVKIWFVLLAIFTFILVWTTFLSGQNNRLSTLNFFAYRRSAQEIQQIYQEDGLWPASAQFQILHGQWWTYIRGFFERYLIYFSPKMLFVDGDYSQRHRVPDLGVLYYFSIFFIPIGIFFFLRQKIGLLIFLWFLIAPIPAVLSRDLISTVRALNIVIPLSIFEAGGALMILKWIFSLKRIWRFTLLGLLLFAIIFNLLIYLDRYFIHIPKEYSDDWMYGYKRLFSNKDLFNKTNLSKYDKVIVTDSFGQPYIFYLLYTKYPPLDFQRQAVLDQPTWDVGSVRNIDNIEFRHINWPTDRGLRKTLFIGTEIELPAQDILPFAEYKVLNEVKLLNGKTSLRVVESL